MKIGTDYLGIMKTALDAYELRKDAISENLANTDTPKYKRKYVRFEEYLNKSYLSLNGAKTNKMHFNIPKNNGNTPVLDVDRNVSTRSDGNNVNVDVENAEAVKNFMRYSAVAQEMTNYFKDLNIVIGGGR